jgi:hypothetical protein
VTNSNLALPDAAANAMESSTIAAPSADFDADAILMVALVCALPDQDFSRLSVTIVLPF